MIGIGVIGAGSFAEQHAAVLEGIPGARVAAACRQQPAAVKRFTDRYGGRGYLDIDDLLEDSGVDAVLIATPHHLHADHAVRAARAGKHILLEKPMAPTVTGCERILEAVVRANVRLMLGHTTQFAHPYRVARSLVQSGELGDVVLGASVMNKIWMEPNRRDWHLGRDTGGGMLLTAGIHALDRLVWLVGSRVSSVAASVEARFHEQEADDLALLFLRFENGASGTVTSTGYSSGAGTHRTELVGTKAHLRVGFAEGVAVGRDERWLEVPGSARADWVAEALDLEWREFLAAIESRREPSVSGEDGRHLIDIIEAAQRSATTRRELPLAPGVPAAP